MKNNNQELRPIYIGESSNYNDDDISLIDLAITIVRRKVLFFRVFVLIFALGTTFALLVPNKFTYSATIEVGWQIIGGTIKYIETPKTLIAKLEHGYITQTLTEHRQTHPEDTKKYIINAKTPEADSSIILLQTSGRESQSEILKGFLQTIIQKAVQDHNRMYQSIKNDMESRLKQANNSLKLLRNSKDNETEVASYQNIIESLSSRLANLHNTREALPPIKSLEPTSTSRVTMVIASILTAIFLGIFAVFTAEFLSKIKEKQKISATIPDVTITGND